MTDTKGNGILNTVFDGYGPYKGDIQYRKQGSLIAYETGETVTMAYLRPRREERCLLERREGLQRHGDRPERKGRGC